jgi:hypothetical protein
MTQAFWSVLEFHRFSMVPANARELIEKMNEIPYDIITKLVGIKNNVDFIVYVNNEIQAQSNYFHLSFIIHRNGKFKYCKDLKTLGGESLADSTPSHMLIGPFTNLVWFHTLEHLFGNVESTFLQLF